MLILPFVGKVIPGHLFCPPDCSTTTVTHAANYEPFPKYRTENLNFVKVDQTVITQV